MGGREVETSDIVCRPRKLIDAIKSWRMWHLLPLLFLTYSRRLPSTRHETSDPDKEPNRKEPQKREKKKQQPPQWHMQSVYDTIRRRNSKIYYPDNCALL